VEHTDFIYTQVSSVPVGRAQELVVHSCWHQHRVNKGIREASMFQKSGLLVLLVSLLIAGCARLPRSPGIVVFTYSTYQGSIEQVNTLREKHSILPADGVHKRLLRWSPDRAYLAFIAVEFDLDGKKDTLWIVDADGDNAHLLFGPAPALWYSWEADSRTIYVEEAVSFGQFPFDEDTVIRPYSIDVETGSVHEVARRTDLFPLPVRSPDGTKSVWTDPTNDEWALYLLDSEGNKLSMIYQPPHGRVVSGVWSPDSQKLAIVKPEDEEIYIYSISSQNWNKLSSLSTTHNSYQVNSVQWSPDGNWISYLLNDQEQVRQICAFQVEEREWNERCFNTQWISNEYVWSSDSRFIVYLGKTPSGETDLFAVDVREDAIINLTQDGNEVIEEHIAR